MPDRIREINKRFIEKVGIETTGNDFARSQIIVLDNKKEPYDIGIERSDKLLYQETEAVNVGINSLENAYIERINQGCRSDLFWRIISITSVLIEDPLNEEPDCRIYNYTLKCESLNGFGYEEEGVDTFIITFEDDEDTEGTRTPLYEKEYLYVLDQTENPVGSYPNGFTTQELDWKGGLTPNTEEGQSYHGWMLDDEPYAEDIVNPTVSSGIGTIALSSNILTFETSVETGNLSGIKTGAILTCDTFGIWFDQKTSVVAYGTTVVGLATTAVSGEVIPVNTTTKTWVETEDFSMREVKVPENDGTFTNFFVLQGPDDLNFDKLALKRTDEVDCNDSNEICVQINDLSPEVPTRVCPLTEDLFGKGVKLEYTNSGGPDKCEEWNKYLEGYPDPDNPADVDARKGKFELNIVKAPENGPGKTWYRDGFTFRPIHINGDPAQEGDVILLNNVGNKDDSCVESETRVLYEELDCSNSELNQLNDQINDAEDSKNELENNLSDALDNNNSLISKLYSLTNTLRQERNEINLRIWAYRLQMGKEQSNVEKWDNRIEIINDPDVYSVLQDPLNPEERAKKEEKNKTIPKN